MARQQQADDAQLLNDEFTRIFDAYRARIDEITRQTQRNLVPDNHAPEAVPAAILENTEAIVPPSPAPPEVKPDIPPATVKLELPAVKESEAIIKEAKRKAHQIIAEAEESIKKEAKKKTQAQVDKIIASAQREAEDIINKAAQAVEKERAEAVSLLKQESEKVIGEITEKCRHRDEQRGNRAAAD
jgi:ribosome recycling factor